MADTIRVFHSVHGAGNAPMALGVASGFFRDAGLDVVMQEIPRTGDAVGKLVEGECEFAVAGAVPIINAALGGHDPLIVMSIEAENVYGIVCAKGIESPEQLRGATIAISGKREQDDIILRRALREWGIDPDRDVTFEVRGSRGNCWDAVVKGEAAAMTATIPQPVLARAIGLPVLKDYLDLHEPYQAGAIVTTRRYANANPDIVRRFLGGQLRAIRLFQVDFEAALPHLKARSKLEDIEVLRETNRLFGLALEHYVPNPLALAMVVKYLRAGYGEPVDVDVNKMIDASFAAELEGRPLPAPYRGELGA
jgi:ABC-type nitrate/sulfonate/bicarbonate transport system substrate-binding protein